MVGWSAAGDLLSLEVYSLLNRTGTSFISTTSSVYSAEDDSTHFYRTVSSDDSQIDAMLQLVRYLGWKYVQVVYTDDTEGTNQFKLFRSKATQGGVCILSSYTIDQHSSAMDVVKAMLTSTTPVVLVFANTEVTSQLVGAKELIGSVAKSLVLLTTEMWEGGSPSTANRSISITSHISMAQDFDAYMRSKVPSANHGDNPWFSQYYESVMECDLGANDRYRRTCLNMDTTPVTSSSKYVDCNS